MLLVDLIVTRSVGNIQTKENANYNEVYFIVIRKLKSLYFKIDKDDSFYKTLSTSDINP